MNINFDSAKKTQKLIANFGSSQSYRHQFVFPTLTQKKKKKPLQRLKTKAKRNPSRGQHSKTKKENGGVKQGRASFF